MSAERTDICVDCGWTFRTPAFSHDEPGFHGFDALLSWFIDHNRVAIELPVLGGVFTSGDFAKLHPRFFTGRF